MYTYEHTFIYIHKHTERARRCIARCATFDMFMCAGVYVFVCSCVCMCVCACVCVCLCVCVCVKERTKATERKQ